MPKQSIDSLQVASGHCNLQSFLEEALAENTLICQNNNPAPRSYRQSVEKWFLSDFGVRYKVLVTRDEHHRQPNEVELFVHVPGWETIREEALNRLESLYGSFVYEIRGSSHSDHDGYDLFIQVHDAVSLFPSSEECAYALSRLRIQMVGAPIYDGLERISRARTSEEDTLHELVTHPRCGSCHCLGTSEKLMIIFTVTIKDDIERSLGRLFCQQFAGVKQQQATATSSSPHVEFRRATDPPKELLNHRIRYNTNLSQDNDACAGYLLFTFFPSVIRKGGEPGREKATELMVNFFPYLDKHIKSTKSYMHTRMRKKKDDLLYELREVTSQKNKKVKNTSSSYAAKNKAFGVARRVQVEICS